MFSGHAKWHLLHLFENLAEELFSNFFASKVAAKYGKINQQIICIWRIPDFFYFIFAKNQHTKKLSLFLFFCLLLSSNNIFASKQEDITQFQNKLENLHKSIDKIQQYLKGTKKQRSTVLTELKTLESEISDNSVKLNSLEDNLQSIKIQKKTLEEELNQLNEQLHNQRAILSEQIRSGYSMGHQQNLKMLLNQQDPAQAGRAQEYFNYINRARMQQISLFQDTLKQKKQTEEELKQTLNTQKGLLTAQKSKKAELQKQRLQRKNLLTELSNKIKNQENTLTSLEES